MTPNDDARSGPSPLDPYSRADYRRVIAWDARIEREAPLLTAVLGRAVDPSVIDLGCGTGEHVAFFASRGARAVGLDRSEAMITAARDYERAGRGRFVLGDFAEADRLLADEPRFGLALCLGNMLPHLLEDSELERFLEILGMLLVPGGRALVQILNYRRILEEGVRALPVNLRPGDAGEEIVFLRLMKPLERGRLLFFPTTLSLKHDAETPLSVVSSRRVELRAWTDLDLLARFAVHGFRASCFGSMTGAAFDPRTSNDLVIEVERDPGVS